MSGASVYSLPKDIIKTIAYMLDDLNDFRSFGFTSKCLLFLLSDRQRIIDRYTVCSMNEYCLGKRRNVWRFAGRYHRDHDLPAIEWKDGARAWYRHGEFHRDFDLPAIDKPQTCKAYYKKGKRHRDNDLPAYERRDGLKAWQYEGMIHRENGKPAVIYPDGRKEFWYKNKRIK